jgi:hypothetical protein
MTWSGVIYVIDGAIVARFIKLRHSLWREFDAILTKSGMNKIISRFFNCLAIFFVLWTLGAIQLLKSVQ